MGLRAGRSSGYNSRIAIRCSIPCSGEKLPVSAVKIHCSEKEQGISRALFKSVCNFASASAKTTPKLAKFVEFPVIFPVVRECAVEIGATRLVRSFLLASVHCCALGRSRKR
jgi:hypothetical protein